MVRSRCWPLLALAACGGTAIIDPDGGGGAGGTSSGMSTGPVGSTSGSTSTSNGTSSTGSAMPTGCTSTAQCCEQICDYVATLPCGGDGCECGPIDGDAACESAFDGLIACLANELPDSVTCTDLDAPQIACGPCNEAVEAFEQACNTQVGCAFD